jgi:hypothetical protein
MLENRNSYSVETARKQRRTRQRTANIVVGPYER